LQKILCPNNVETCVGEREGKDIGLEIERLEVVLSAPAVSRIPSTAPSDQLQLLQIPGRSEQLALTWSLIHNLRLARDPDAILAGIGGVARFLRDEPVTPGVHTLHHYE
jgi:hypothetical protein